MALRSPDDPIRNLGRSHRVKATLVKYSVPFSVAAVIPGDGKHFPFGAHLRNGPIFIAGSISNANSIPSFKSKFRDPAFFAFAFFQKCDGARQVTHEPKPCDYPGADAEKYGV